MLNFQEMIKVIDQLSPEELRELRNYIDQREAQSQPAHRLSPEERIRRLDEAARAIRAGFTEAEWAEVERAMNEEYIEPADDDFDALPVKRENWHNP